MNLMINITVMLLNIQNHIFLQLLCVFLHHFYNKRNHISILEICLWSFLYSSYS